MGLFALTPSGSRARPLCWVISSVTFTVGVEESRAPGRPGGSGYRQRDHCRAHSCALPPSGQSREGILYLPWGRGRVGLRHRGLWAVGKLLPGGCGGWMGGWNLIPLPGEHLTHRMCFSQVLLGDLGLGLGTALGTVP